MDELQVTESDRLPAGSSITKTVTLHHATDVIAVTTGRLSTSMRLGFAAACAFLLTACPLLQSLRPPAVTANPIPTTLFASSGPRVLSANITAGGSGIVITGIELRVNRDRDSTRFTNETPHVFTVQPPAAQAGRVSITLPSTLQFAPGQLVTAKWFVDYMVRNGGTDTATVSATVSARQDCTSRQVRTFLTSLQAGVVNPVNFPQTLANPADLARLLSLGFTPSHGFRSFRGQGVAFAAVVPVLTGINLSPPTTPQLLFYAPPATAPATAVEEPVVPDFPYSLIGFAFASQYDPSGPPTFGCMPREAWFVHEAGWHPADGGFIPQEVTESTFGDADPALPPYPRVDAVWHGRMWDVHLFIRPTEQPVLSACNPAAGAPLPADFFAATGLSTCTAGFPQVPATGTFFPPAGFFVRVLPP
jgi:hypothetical protein